MLLTIRIPRAGAERLGLPPEGQAAELETTMSSVELAGRLTLASGWPIGPRAVERYVTSLQLATAAVGGVRSRPDSESLVSTFAAQCHQRLLWTPSHGEGLIAWLSCVFTAHFLTAEGAVDGEVAAAAWSEKLTADELVALCAVTFPTAYHLWVSRGLDQDPEPPDGVEEPTPNAATSDSPSPAL